MPSRVMNTRASAACRRSSAARFVRAVPVRRACLRGRVGPRLGRAPSPSASAAVGLGLAAFAGLLGRRLRRLARLLRRLALGALLAHLDHRRAVVVEAQLPGTAAEALDRQPRALAADRAALLEPPELVAAARQRAAEVARVGDVGVVAVVQPSQPTSACRPCSSMIRSRFGEPSSRLRPASSQTTQGPRNLSSSMPAQISFARSSLLVLELGRRRVQHLAADPQRPRPWTSRRRRSRPCPARARRSSPASPSAARTRGRPCTSRSRSRRAPAGCANT